MIQLVILVLVLIKMIKLACILIIEHDIESQKMEIKSLFSKIYIKNEINYYLLFIITGIKVIIWVII